MLITNNCMDSWIIYSVIGLIFLICGIYLGMQMGKMISNREWSKRIPEIRKDATKRSRAVLTGQVTEQLAPYLPGFRYRPTEARFIGKPIDFIVFEGLDEKEIENVVFVEVKSGMGRLSKVEQSLKSAIDEGRVSWEEYKM